MAKPKIRAFFKDNAPYIFGGGAIAALTLAAQFMVAYTFHQVYGDYLRDLGSSGFATGLYYLNQALIFAGVVAGAYFLFRAGKVPRPLALAVLGVGIFSILHTLLPWLLWRLTAYLQLPGYLLMEALYGAAAFVLARYALKKLQQNAAVYMVGVTLMIGSYILPMIILQLLFRGWD